MRLITTLSRAAGLGLCVVAFTGSALADPGKGNGNGPESTPPGQEKKAETPAAAAPAPQAASGQEKKAENKPAAASTAKAAPPGQQKKAENQQKKAAKQQSKPATSGSFKNTSSGNDLKKGVVGGHKHTICHATGSESNPFVRITPSVSGVFNGHMGHQGDEDIVPPFVYKGTTYSQNWDAEGQALFAANCEAPGLLSTTQSQSNQQNQQTTTTCPATVTTTENVLVGVRHFTGATKDGQRKFVEISPSEKSAHLNGKHPDDEPIFALQTITRSFSGENCAAVTSTNISNISSVSSTSSSSSTSNVETSVATTQAAVESAQLQAGGVAGAVSKAPSAKKAKAKPAGGVLGAVASAPEAIASTATGDLPFTGIPLWIAALIGMALLGAGLTLRRST